MLAGFDPSVFTAAAAVRAFDIGAVRYAQHGIMRIEEIRLSKKGRICRDQGDVAGVSKVNERVFCSVFYRIAAPAEFDIQMLGKQRLKTRQVAGCRFMLPFTQQPSQRTLCTACKSNKAIFMRGQLLQCHMRVEVFWTIKMCHRDQATQIIITALILRKQWQPVACELTVAGWPPDPKQRANDRLHTIGFSRVLKWHHAIETIAIANGNSGKAELFCSLANRLRLNRTFQYGVSGIHAQRNKGNVGHLATLDDLHDSTNPVLG